MAGTGGTEGRCRGSAAFWFILKMVVQGSKTKTMLALGTSGKLRRGRDVVYINGAGIFTPRAADNHAAPSEIKAQLCEMGYSMYIGAEH
jgi:hypothetical protein